MNSILLLIFLLPLGLSASFIFRGLRGFRVGDHPICRRCAFDLFGQPVGTVICGECGSPLSQPNSVLIGHHQRRKGLILAGIFILIPVLLTAGILLCVLIDDINWMRYAALRLVIWRAESPDRTTRSPAVAELLRRCSSLESKDLDRVVDVGLSYQGDLTKPWDPKWGDVLEQAKHDGKMSAERWQRYVDQAWQGTLALKLPSSIRDGGSVNVGLECKCFRVSYSSDLVFRASDPCLTCQGVQILPNGLPGSYFLMSMAIGKNTFNNQYPLKFPAGIGYGTASVELHCTISVGIANQDNKPDPVISGGNISLIGKTNLLPTPNHK
jgi:hypothetical protein